MSSLNNDDCAEDPIIKEIPVFLSQKASEDIRLLQYPIRTANRSLDRDERDLGQVRDVQYDVEHNKLSLKYYLNTDSQRYMNEEEDGELMHISFTSKSVKQHTNYCVAIMRNDEFHINPIQSIYQMRTDFNHCNPNLTIDEDNDANLNQTNVNIVNCQIIHDTDNDDLYYNQEKQHQTRQFITEKQSFLHKCLSNDEKKSDEKYDGLADIPPGITRQNALKLPLKQSVFYYLRECIVLKASQIFEQLNCGTADKQVIALQLLSKYAWFVNGRFIVKHAFLRDPSLKYHKKEWNLLLALFYNLGGLRKKQFIDEIGGSEQIEYELVEKMFNLLSVPHQSAAKKVVWCLKHDNGDCDMLDTQFFELYKKANESMKALAAKNPVHIHINSKQQFVGNDKEELEENDPRQTDKYGACKKFLIQKLRKQKVLLRECVVQLVAKYAKNYSVLSEMPNEILDMVRDDFCWIIHDDRYCLKEIEEFEEMKQYNQHRKAIIDWFNKRNKTEIKKSTAYKQWKKLIKPDEETYEIIVASLCDWNDRKKVWCLKSGIRSYKKKKYY